MRLIFSIDDISHAARRESGAHGRNDMRTMLIGLFSAAAIITLPAVSAAGEWEVGGDAEIKQTNVSESDQMSKFNEYRDIEDGVEATVNVQA